MGLPLGTDQKRDDIGHSHNNTDQQSIRHFHDTGSGKTNNTDNKGINDFPTDKTDKGIAGKTDILNKLIS